MVQTVAARPNEPQPHVVLRAIFIGGERQEVGATVVLSRTVGTELVSAGKVRRATAEDIARATKKRKPEQPAADPAAE